MDGWMHTMDASCIKKLPFSGGGNTNSSNPKKLFKGKKN
jgi:hypothetical protein